MTYDEMHKAAMDKTMELLEGAGPYHNITPTFDLVMAAWALGYDLVKKPATAGAQHE